MSKLTINNDLTTDRNFSWETAAKTQDSGVIRIPSLTTIERNALTPTVGMLIWNTTLAAIESYNGTNWDTRPHTLLLLTYAAPTGTVTCTGTTVITGSGTNFLSCIKAGDTIIYDGVSGTVSYVKSNTTLILTGNGTAKAGVSYTVTQQPLADNSVYIQGNITSRGQLSVKSLVVLPDNNTDAIAFYSHTGFNGIRINGTSQGLGYEVTDSISGTLTDTIRVDYCDGATGSGVEIGSGLDRQSNLRRNSGTVERIFAAGRDVLQTNQARTLAGIVNRNPTATLPLNAGVNYWDIVDYDTTLLQETVHFAINHKKEVYAPVEIGKSKDLSDNVATSLFEIAATSDTGASLIVDYGITVIDTVGHGVQTECGQVFVNATNTNGTEGENTSKINSQQKCTSGTLTVTFTSDTGTNDKVIVKVTSDTSLTATSHKIWYKIKNLSEQLITLL